MSNASPPASHPMAEILRGESGALRAGELLAAGKLVALPTETVYGLGADATNPQAIARVFEVKQRPSFDPLIVHVPSLGAARAVAHFNPLAEQLARAFWPGPLTLVLPKQRLIPDLVTAGRTSVGVRIPNQALTLRALERAGKPIAAPSANPFGYISPTRVEHVLDQLGSKIDAVLDGGPCEVGVESTVVLANADHVALLRHGGLSQEAIAEEIGAERVRSGVPVYQEIASASGQSLGQLAPGRLASHYAPSVPLRLMDGGKVDWSGVDWGALKPKRALLALRAPADTPRERFDVVIELSAEGDLREAAAHLFASMRELDRRALGSILALRMPDSGLGRAINDRLQRAGGGSGPATRKT